MPRNPQLPLATGDLLVFASSGNIEGEGAAQPGHGVFAQTRRPGNKTTLPHAAGPAGGSPGAIRGKSPLDRAHPRSTTPAPSASCRELHACTSATHYPAVGGRSSHTCKTHGRGSLQYAFPPVFLLIVALEEYGEISETLAYLVFSKSTLKVSLPPLSPARQGPIM